MQFQLEALSLDFFEEALPLFYKHYGEISPNPDIPMRIDFDRYLKMQEQGILRNFTARDESGDLLGYAVFYVCQAIRYLDSKQAQQDVIYLEPSGRGHGIGSAFVDWCEGYLKAEGVQVIYHHAKVGPKDKLGPLLEKKGYRPVDLIYMKRLDREGA